MKRGTRTISRSGRALDGVHRRQRRDLDEHQHQRGDRGAGRLAEIARREHVRREHILCEDDELRPDHRGEHATGKHPGHDLGPERLARGVGGGEAVGIMRGGVEPAAEGADEQQPELAVHHRRIGNQPGRHAEHRAGLQRETPAVAAGERADRQRAEPHADHHAGDRQRRQPLVGGEHRADDRCGRDDDGVVAAGERLRPPPAPWRCAAPESRRRAIAGSIRRWPTCGIPGKKLLSLAAKREWGYCQ